MKVFSNFKSGLIKLVLGVIIAAPFAASCFYDDSELREKIDMLVDKVYELEAKMNSEIAALQAMLRGNVMISNVSRDASTGITTVTLSDGTKLQLLPEQDMESYITYLILGDGKAYWAYINADGKKELFKDDKGQAIPVETATPKVVEIDGETYLEIGGSRYPLSGNSVFSDYEIITDELTGEIYAVTFTFGDDMTFTVTVDGACGFYFVKSSFWSTEIISDYYVANGVTERVQIDARGVVDYVLQIPDGWRVKEYEDIYMGGLYFDIAAPSKELVESGVAAADGDLKVVAVLEGGKATVARLYVTTSPFKSFGFSLGNVFASAYNGLQKYAYGVCLKSEYDEAAVLETAEGLLTAFDYPAGYGIATEDLLLSVEEVLGQEPVAGEQYVFWAIPALYYETYDDAGYYLAEGTAVTAEFVYSSIKFEVSNETFRDANLSMDLKGVSSYYTGLVKAEDFYLEDVVYCLNNPGYYTAQTSPLTYEGSVFTFAGVTGEEATEYVAWIAVDEAGKTYTAADLVLVEFSTLNLTPGSSVKVANSNDKVQATEIKTTLTASGAETIFYSFVSTSDAKKYTDDAARANYLFEKGLRVKAQTADVAASDVLSKINPLTTYYLYAVAVDAEGYYGDVLVVEYTTTDFQYNNLTISYEILMNDPGNVVIAIESEGAEEFLYWIGRTADNTWKSSNYLGGSAESAQVYMYKNPTQSRLVTAMEKYPVVDGKVTMTDLEMSQNYVFVAMAKDADGLYSKAFAFFFEPRPVAIGNVVESTDPKWEAARPTVKFTPEVFVAAAGQMPGTFGFDVTIPAGFTGYVLAGTDSYLNEGNPDLVLTSAEKIVKIIQNVDKPRSNNVTVDYDLWGEKGYPYGYEFFHYEHGNPQFGNVVIWASWEYHDSVCDCPGEYIKKITVTNATEGPVEVDEHWLVNINDGKPVAVRQPYAMGSTTEVIDRVFVVCQDLDGNCYAPFEYDVDPQLFANAGSRDE